MTQTMDESVGWKEHSRIGAFCALETFTCAIGRALSHSQYMSVQLPLEDGPVCVSKNLLSPENATDTNSTASQSPPNDEDDNVLRFFVATRSNTVTSAPEEHFSATAR